MPPKQRCCDCPCYGDNCFQGKEKGCNHPCCYCEDIIGIDDCDPTYCTKLGDCFDPDGSDCTSKTFTAVISYPASRPNDVWQSPLGVMYELPNIENRKVFTNVGLGIPPGVGLPGCDMCDGLPCEDCSESRCNNCGNSGIGPIANSRFVNTEHASVSTEKTWPGTAGSVTVTATYQSNCKWKGSAYIAGTGNRKLLYCTSSYVQCGDPRVESTTICECPPEACLDSTHPDHAACEESYQCNEFNPVWFGGQAIYDPPSCWDDPQPSVAWQCCTNEPDGNYLCDGFIEVGSGIPSVNRCVYAVADIPIKFKAEYEIYFSPGNLCKKGQEQWVQRVSFKPEYDFATAFPDGLPDGWIWAPPACGALLVPPNKGFSKWDCAPVVDCDDYDPEDCLTWKSTFHEYNRPCPCATLGSEIECGCCHYDGDGTCVDACGIVEWAEKKWGHILPESVDIGEWGWTCCGQFYTGNFEADYYYNGRLAETIEMESFGAGTVGLPCEAKCPELQYLATDWGAVEWTGFRVEVS